MRPPTPQLDEIARQLLTLIHWWLNGPWWHSWSVILATLVVAVNAILSVLNHIACIVKDKKRNDETSNN